MPDMLVRLDVLADGRAERAALRCAGIVVRRIAAYEAGVLRAFVAGAFSDGWADEAQRCFVHQPPSCFVAVSEGKIVGFAVHECTRRGFFGPMGVDPGFRGRGVGMALLLTSLAAMRDLDYKYAVIGWVGPQGFYERHAGAKVIEGSEYSIGPDWLLPVRPESR
ncbi:MAG: GNAT family N-acetyltransferase [Bacillota bacterium]|nr:GNAT family N-acetyltransferase [Bacillota bacterium]